MKSKSPKNKNKFDCTSAKKFCRPEDHTGFLIWQVTHLLKRNLTNKLAVLGITHMQFQILAGTAWLTRDDNILTQIELAEFIKIDPMMVSQVIKLLEKKKLMKRRAHPQDSRAKAILLTTEGYELLENAIEVVNEVNENNFSAIDEKKLHKILLKLFNDLTQKSSDLKKTYE
jgi:DNA-binding MarR family transcriptional regulator